MHTGKEIYLITGGAGFIGSSFVLAARKKWDRQVVTLDALTYSGNIDNLNELQDDPEHTFIHGDINDAALIASLLKTRQPDALIHFAAESHVDRSIYDPEIFVTTNVQGTCTLLKQTLAWWQDLPAERRERFRFVHVSTDEVFGSLTPTDPPFTEATPYAPNSPYSASKAASDHFAHAFHETYGLPILITNCSNNYGPRQFPEKLIPLIINNALENKTLPIYGTGQNIRDWLYVDDHCDAIEAVLHQGKVGQSYNIGGLCEKSNLEVVAAVCAILDELRPSSHGPYSRLITHVADRPGHDFRYAMNIAKIIDEIGWRPQESFHSGLRKTIVWYLENNQWVKSIHSGAYREWTAKNYHNRQEP